MCIGRIAHLHTMGSIFVSIENDIPYIYSCKCGKEQLGVHRSLLSYSPPVLTTKR